MNKIICLIESLGPGGAERQMSYLAAVLKREGYDVELWTYFPNDFYKYILDEAGVKYRYIPEATSKLKRVYILKRELKKASPSTVIAYLNTPSLVACIIKLLGGNFKLIVSERNTTQKTTLKDRVKFFVFRFANWIVPNSYSQEQYIKTNFATLSKKVHTITNFVDTEFFVSDIKKKSDHNYLDVLVVGRIMPQKNVLCFMKAVKMARDKGCDIRVKWYGNATDKTYMESCTKLQDQLELTDFFKIYPATKNILVEYQQSDLFCLPSIYEGFPNVLCEAMSCGMPVLCSNVCDNPSIVKDSINGYLFNPHNPEDIAESLIKMYTTSRSKLYEMGEESRKIIVEQYSIESYKNKYLNLIS